MAAKIQEKFGVKAELVKSGGGVFEVSKNDKLIFSKKATGKFPIEAEVLKSLEE